MRNSRTLKGQNFVGQKFNRLTILRQYHEPPFLRQRVDCQCDCGSQTSTSLSKVILGITKSCRGCAPRPDGSKNRKAFGYAAFNRLFASYVSNAKRKKLNFDLTKEEAKKIFESNCFYCGIQPSQVMSSPRLYGTYTYNGIDRKDNHQGYMMDNVVACCSKCNYLKNNYSTDEFISHVRKIANFCSELK